MRTTLRAGRSAAIAQSLKTAQFSNGIPGIDGVVNFTGSFNTFGLDGFGNPHSNTWYFAYVGNAPSKGTPDDTHIGAPIIPVTIQIWVRRTATRIRARCRPFLTSSARCSIRTAT